jgi:hypothetical protein
MIRRIMIALPPIILVSTAAASETCTVADPTGHPLERAQVPEWADTGAL